MFCVLFAEIGSSCTALADCSNAVTNSYCTVGAGDTCQCLSGHTASANNLQCNDNGKEFINTCSVFDG